MKRAKYIRYALFILCGLLLLFLFYFVFSIPSAQDHDLASDVLKAVSDELGPDYKLTMFPHPFAVIIEVHGISDEQEQSQIKEQIKSIGKNALMKLSKKRFVLVDFIENEKTS